MIVCKPNDYYLYSKTLAKQYGVYVAILASYLQDTLTCKPDCYKLNLDHISTITGMSKKEIKEAVKVIQNNNLLEVNINNEIIISYKEQQEQCALRNCPISELIENTVKNKTNLSKQTDKYLNKANKNNDIIYNEILDYANKTWGTSFTCTSEVKKLIKKQLSTGHTKEEFFKVIDDRYKEWGLNPILFKSSGRMSNEYLRPRTVFSAKFEDYLRMAEKKTLVELRPATYKTASTDICKDLEF